MKLEGKYIDELIEFRRKARENRNWALADRIRDHLDKKHSFVFDTEKGQVIYHAPGLTRKKLILRLRKEARAERLFESWLFTVTSGMLH